ncbi:hypothetical protein [Massilia sp. TSP1-1-2]|uniref:hypothetical protein n=1 Tax=Massilia sp. TSP1-1-2 TaxID=2804649 RepID=UPI003CE7A341
MSAIAGFVGGLQQGYTFVDDMKRKQTDDGRRVKDDARREQAAEFAEESRGRTRKGWDKEDEYQSEVDALDGGFFPKERKEPPAPAIGMQSPAPGANAPADPAVQQTAVRSLATAAPAAPAISAPKAPPPIDGALAGAPDASSPVAPVAAGMPQSAPAAAAPQAGLPQQANQMTSMGASMDYLIKRAQIDMRHGKIDGPGIANLYKLRASAAKEGLNEAVSLLAQGDNEGAMKRFNETGDMKDWHVQSSVDGVFRHGGVDIPTKIVTVKAADGTTRTVNTAQNMVQSQLIDTIVTQAQKGVALDDSRADAKVGRHIQQQNADTQEGYRRDQADNMKEQRRLQEAALDAKTVPAAIWGEKDDAFLKEHYSGKDEVSGAKSFDGDGMQFAKQVAVARSRSNGGDAATASAYALAADANLKVQAGGDAAKLRQLRNEALQQLIKVAPAPPAGGTEWEQINANSRAGAPAREAGRRDVLLEELKKATRPEDIASLKRELARLGPTSAPAGVVSGPVKAAARAASAPAAAPAAPQASTTPGQEGHIQTPNGVDVRNDVTIRELNKSLAKLDKNDVRNTQTLMALGTAFNTRMQQLQDNYGSGAHLIAN